MAFNAKQKEKEEEEPYRVEEEEEEEDDDNEGEEEWDDWEGEEEGEAESESLCLFCDSSYGSCGSLFDHCASIHHFDFHSLRKALHLDFYASFKLINYIRSQVFFLCSPVWGLSKNGISRNGFDSIRRCILNFRCNKHLACKFTDFLWLINLYSIYLRIELLFKKKFTD